MEEEMGDLTGSIAKKKVQDCTGFENSPKEKKNGDRERKERQQNRFRTDELNILTSDFTRWWPCKKWRNPALRPTHDMTVRVIWAQRRWQRYAKRINKDRKYVLRVKGISNRGKERHLTSKYWPSKTRGYSKIAKPSLSRTTFNAKSWEIGATENEKETPLQEPEGMKWVCNLWKV